MHKLKLYDNLIAQYHRRTAQFSDLSNVDVIYQWQIHASLNLQFWNYPYYKHDIRKCQVSTVNKEHNTLSTVFPDEKPYVQGQFLKVYIFGHQTSLS